MQELKHFNKAVFEQRLSYIKVIYVTGINLPTSAWFAFTSNRGKLGRFLHFFNFNFAINAILMNIFST